jgi:hypothetical protein
MSCRLSLLAILLLSGSAGAEWKAGFARVRITPEKPMWMSGYASRDKPAEGKLHDLWAKALALEDARAGVCVLITLDLVGIPRELSVKLCQEISKQHDLPRGAICLSCSHTHTGPVVRGNLDTMYGLDETQSRLVAEYRGFLEKRIVAVAGEALKGLAPARLAWGNGEAKFAVNRRNNKEADVPKLIEEGKLKGPVDHQVPVLKVSDAKDQLKAVLFGYACHATVLPFYQWSGDYPGFAMIELEKRHPGALALFWAGCGGDQNPLPRRKVELAEKYGKELASAVEAVLKIHLRPIDGSLAVVYHEIDLPLAELPTREKLVEDSMAKNKYVAIRARALLEQLKTNGSLRSSYPYPVQAWQLGNGPALLTLGGEVVVDYALRLKKELGPDNLWVMSYANDVMAYIPSLRVLKEGGYEGGGAMVYYGLPAIWSPRVEELIVKEAHELVKKVRNR